MQLKKYDIGAEIISILTKGIYPDPRDAIREYIQNAIDANSTSISIEVQQTGVVITDDGNGMDHTKMRQAIRLGVSDKQPGKDVGFMGIGIYSAFHLCDMLVIYSKCEEQAPSKMIFNFKEMRQVLNEQKNRRIEGADSSHLIGLQTLLENSINHEVLTEKDYPKQGTSVELLNLDSVLKEPIYNLGELKKYLQDTVPLHFDKNFSKGQEIEKKIKESCTKHQEKFQAIDLLLTVGGVEYKLYKPYYDDMFHAGKTEDLFYEEIKYDNKFLGVIWGLISSERKTVKESKLKGFLLKKQGFSIGNRINLLRHFSKGKATAPYFNRSTGEVIVINAKLLPNAARNGLSPSVLQKQFDIQLDKVATKYNKIGKQLQNYGKGMKTLQGANIVLKELIRHNYEFEEDINKLIGDKYRIDNHTFDLKNQIQRKYFDYNDHSKENAKQLLESLKNISILIQNRINTLAKAKKETQKKKGTQSTLNRIDIAKQTPKIDTTINQKKYVDLIDVLNDLELFEDKNIPDYMQDIFIIFDENFINQVAQTPAHYQQILQELKIQISDIIDN